jgi:serine/threonine protein kinase
MASDRQIPKNLLPIPFLSKPEVKSGAILGRGSFCKVSVVKSLTLQQFFGNAPQEEARTHLNQRLISAGTSCAIKELKDFKSKSVLTRAEEDLKRELQILKGIHKNAGREAHPHIIELYAIGVETLVEAEAECETSPTFLILSKIDCTLKDILKTWRQERGFGFREMMGINIKKSRDLWLDRIILISKITDAIQFLHDRCIIYRDLKPDNIGVDGDSVPKLFDFGLAKKMESPSLDSNDTYQLTGNTGTLRCVCFRC